MYPFLIFVSWKMCHLNIKLSAMFHILKGNHVCSFSFLLYTTNGRGRGYIITYPSSPRPAEHLLLCEWIKHWEGGHPYLNIWKPVGPKLFQLPSTQTQIF